MYSHSHCSLHRNTVFKHKWRQFRVACRRWIWRGKICLDPCPSTIIAARVQDSGHQLFDGFAQKQLRTLAVPWLCLLHENTIKRFILRWLVVSTARCKKLARQGARTRRNLWAFCREHPASNSRNGLLCEKMEFLCWRCLHFGFLGSVLPARCPESLGKITVIIIFPFLCVFFEAFFQLFNIRFSKVVFVP